MQCNVPPPIKRSIAQIRLSSHDLEIERGRRTRPKPTSACERSSMYDESRTRNPFRNRMPYVR